MTSSLLIIFNEFVDLIKAGGTDNDVLLLGIKEETFCTD